MKTQRTKKIKRTQLGKSHWDNSGIYQKSMTNFMQNMYQLLNV